ncbi:MAG TPA: LysR family transcriptional regulator [Pseudolabrys sp.]|nr:LysR family transcriptional regulator [Pseudolabrys sp.]
MEWDDFKHFLAVARTGSLSEAARTLKTSPATVGRRIAALEERLAVRLFDRAQTGYALTESGEAIRLKAEEVEEAVLSVEREAFGRDLRATGKVRVATAEDIAAFVIAPKLIDFRRVYPGIVLEMVSSWDVVNLTRREADIAIRTVRPAQGDFVIRLAGVWNCALYASKEYAAKKKLQPGLNDFRDFDVISWTEESNFRGGDWFDTYARGASVVFAANSRHIQYAACKAGLGAAILPCLAADRDAGLVRLLPPERVRSVDLWLVAHQDLIKTARVRAVLDFLADIVPKRSHGHQ